MKGKDYSILVPDRLFLFCIFKKERNENIYRKAFSAFKISVSLECIGRNMKLQSSKIKDASRNDYKNPHHFGERHVALNAILSMIYVDFWKKAERS